MLRPSPAQGGFEGGRSKLGPQRGRPLGDSDLSWSRSLEFGQSKMEHSIYN